MTKDKGDDDEKAAESAEEPPPWLFEDQLDLGEPNPLRPTIRLNSEIPRIVEKAVAALASAGDLYSRAGALVCVVRNTDAPESVRRAIGAVNVREVSTSLLPVFLSRAAKWERYDERAQGWVLTKPPRDIVCAVHASHAWGGIREIAGILEAPALRPDGSVIQDAGFDDATGYLYEPSATFARIPETPTQVDAVKAARELLEVVVDFPFASDEHRAAWLAFALTLFARPAIDGNVPLMAIDATTPGTGKGRLADATAILATGRPAAKTPMPEDDEEFRKRITTLILEAEPLACLDNISIPIAFPALDAALTTTVWKDRLLGRSETMKALNRLVWVATGNNLAFGADTARRSLHIRLESQLENPEDRDDFTHPQLLQWVLAERPRLVVAALTILRAFAVAGMPRGVKVWGGFEEWSNVVASAVVWAGVTDPQDTRSGLTVNADATKNVLAALVDGWARLSGNEGMTCKTAIGVLYPARGGAPEAPDGHDDLREAIESLVPAQAGKPPSTMKLGLALRTFKRRVVGGRMLDARMGAGKTWRWHVVQLIPRKPYAGVRGAEDMFPTLPMGFADAKSHTMGVDPPLIPQPPHNGDAFGDLLNGGAEGGDH